MTSALASDIVMYLAKVTGIEPPLRSIKAPTHGCACAELSDYPSKGVTTTVSAGLASFGRSMWRALPLGYEIVTCVETGALDAAELLGAVIQEEYRRSSSGDRRRLVEANGVFAPGYPPHLLFTEVVALTPGLLARKKLGDQYVQFLQGVPIDDAELRRYDRDIPAFVQTLASSGQAMKYPRSRATD